jgi:integrase
MIGFQQSAQTLNRDNLTPAAFMLRRDDPIEALVNPLVMGLPDGRERPFTDRFNPKRWDRIRKAVGLPELRFHDLRKTFASLPAQR